MTISNYHDLYEAIQIRHAVRNYDRRPLSASHLEALKQVCGNLPGLVPGIRVILIEEPGDLIFPRLIINGAPAYLVMIGDTSWPHVGEGIGYSGEYVVLTAASLGVGTCWVSGTFRPKEIMKKIDFLNPTEKIFAVSPLGYPGKTGILQTVIKKITGSGSRIPLSELLSKDSLPLAEIPYWAKIALEAARLAPSAVNRQPWQFTVTNDKIKVSVNNAGKKLNDVTKRLDCGIAMFHLELGAMAVGEFGEWKLLNPPDVAIYILKKDFFNLNFTRSNQLPI